MIIHADPSIASDNVGDKVISRYVKAELEDLFPGELIIDVPTQLWTLSRRLRRRLADSKAIFIGGSNLLSFRYPRIHQWANIHQFLPFANKVSFFGVGWQSYEDRIWPGNRMMFSAFQGGMAHSVRDSYTQKKLAMAGISSLNTGCPTVWKLNSAPIVVQRFSSIVVTLTYYRRNLARDRVFLHAIRSIATSRGAEVVFWPQSPADVDYFRDLDIDNSLKIKTLSGTLEAFEEVIDAGALYVGTRLHAGIHALNLGADARIFAIDNRATTMGKDFNLPVFASPGALEPSLETNYVFRIPRDEISSYRDSFIAGVLG